MPATKPNYTDLGLSSPMSFELRKLVENHLLLDLKSYGATHSELQFDWSESCIEGHDAQYIGSHLENYSGIAVFNAKNELLADGWMEFILAGSFFLTFWDFLTLWKDGQQCNVKSRPGIPDHIWQQIPEDIRGSYQKDRMKQPPFLKSVL